VSNDLTKPAKRTSNSFAQRGWTAVIKAYSSSYMPRHDQDALIASGLEPLMCERTNGGQRGFFYRFDLRVHKRI
jgi:hypothetical protein